MPTLPPLDQRFLENLRSLGVGERPVHLLVALSGGRDSVTLLFLLRFCVPSLPITLSAAHLDHAMRADSAADADWVRGLCTAWGVPLVGERLAAPPGSEAEARRARYEFLRRAGAAQGAQMIVTAHHADDQAETVLFRALRGSGLAGLRGIRAVRGSLLRPLLPFWRREIQAFARQRGLRWREDATNLRLDPARNRLRNQVIPLLEREVAPGARRNLLSLAEIAAEAEEALARSAGRAARRLVRPREGGFLLARAELRVYDSATGSRVLRYVLRRFGVVLSRTGTRRALAFITGAASGREMQLPGGIRVRTEFDSAWIGRDAEPPTDQALSIAAPAFDGAGRGLVVLAGARYRIEHRVVTWPEGAGMATDFEAALPLASLRFPLLLRGWQPGDRMRTSGGSKSLKKLFVEHRVPRSLRSRLPVLLDETGWVLWVGGVPRRPIPSPAANEETFILTALHD